jgi:hypothetical protein
MLRSFRALSLVVLAILAALLSACGGASSSDVKNTLDKAFSAPIKSAKVNLDLTLKLDGVKQLNGPVKLSVQGPYESGGSQTIPKVDFDIAASAAGQNFSAAFISTGDNAWVGFQGQNYEVGKAAIARVNEQIKQAGAHKKGLSQFGIDARNWLKDATDEGTETVAGVQTDHVSAALDVSKFVEDINKLVAKAAGNLSGGSRTPQLTPQEKKQIEDVVKNPRFDVYVGKSDNVIRRLSADVSFEVPKAKQAQLGGLTSGTLSFSIEFADVGKPQTITTPTSSKPLSELTSQLGGLGGVLGAVAGSGSPGSASSGNGSSSSGPSADALQKYSKCLQNADPSKPAELQKCAKLVQ